MAGVAVGAAAAVVAAVVVARGLRTQPPRVDPRGRVVVVTGCDTGFGRMVSERLARAGAIVAAGCYTEKGREELARALPATALVLRLDVTSQASVDAFAAAVHAKHPDQIYALINNAGINICSIIELAGVQQFTQTFDVNVFGTIRVTKAFLGAIRRSRGRIVNIASMAGTVALPGQAAYAASKHAAVGFTDALRREMHPFGVTVVSIEPVMMRTPIVDDWLAGHQLRQDWAAASDEARRAYGPTFVDDFMKATATFVNNDLHDPIKVILALEAALFDGQPAVRYQVGANWLARTMPGATRTSFGDSILRGLMPMPVAPARL